LVARMASRSVMGRFVVEVAIHADHLIIDRLRRVPAIVQVPLKGSPHRLDVAEDDRQGKADGRNGEHSESRKGICHITVGSKSNRLLTLHVG